jgi:Ser/Thr protein kinase RdoA (MazF antagonist)
MSMNTLQGTVKNGQIVLDAPVPLPEGTRVEVLPVDGNRCSLGMREEDRPTTPEAIGALLARMDQVEPGWLSPEDDAAWRAALRAQQECEKAKFFEDGDKLRDIWR